MPPYWNGLSRCFGGIGTGDIGLHQGDANGVLIKGAVKGGAGLGFPVKEATVSSAFCCGVFACLASTTFSSFPLTSSSCAGDMACRHMVCLKSVSSSPTFTAGVPGLGVGCTTTPTPGFHTGGLFGFLPFGGGGVRLDPPASPDAPAAALPGCLPGGSLAASGGCLPGASVADMLVCELGGSPTGCLPPGGSPAATVNCFPRPGGSPTGCLPEGSPAAIFGCCPGGSPTAIL